MDENLKQLKQRIRELTDDQLLEMVSAGAGDYRKEALDYAHAEIAERGLDTSEAEEVGTVPEEDHGGLDLKGMACINCGGPMVAGTLVAEKEMTIVFDRPRVERFVRALACSKCGHMSLVADLQTDVQS